MKDQKIPYSEYINYIATKKGINLIPILFTSDELSNSIKQIKNLESKIKLEDGADLLNSEKCVLLANEAYYTENNVDPLLIAIDNYNKNEKTDSDNNYTMADYSLNSKDQIDLENLILKPLDLFKNPQYYKMFCLHTGLTEEEILQLNVFRERNIKNSAGINDIPNFFDDENISETFIIFNNAAKIAESHDNDAGNWQDLLKDLRVAKIFVNIENRKYHLWETAIKDKQEQITYFTDMAKQMQWENNDNIELGWQTAILITFVQYYVTYSRYWRDYYFGSAIKYHFRTPEATVYFIEFLKKHKYGTEFCEEYERYIKENPGVKPLFDTKLVLDPIPTLERDKEGKYKKWYIEIKTSKLKVQTDEGRYKAFSDLYDKLIDTRYISQHSSKKVFVYRFTGFLTSVDLENKIEWLGSIGEWAFLIMCLYKSSEDKPPYTPMSKYFHFQNYIPKKTNNSYTTLGEKLDEKKMVKVLSILEESGFEKDNIIEDVNLIRLNQSKSNV